MRPMLPALARARETEGRLGLGDDGLGLGFEEPGGPLLAVCGLAGGVGTTTLAYLVAVCAARESDVPVLACDTGGPAAALASLAQVSSRRSLPELAELAEDGEPAARQVFATGPHGLRLIATGPRFRIAGATAGVETVLEHARAAHGLTVIDCGTLGREPEQTALQLASHAAWVAPTTTAGLARAERALELIRPCAGRELVIAWGARARDRRGLAGLKRLAASRRAPLVLLPSLAELSLTSDVDAAVAAAQTALAAIGAVLRQ